MDCPPPIIQRGIIEKCVCGYEFQEKFEFPENGKRNCLPPETFITVIGSLSSTVTLNCLLFKIFPRHVFGCIQPAPAFATQGLHATLRTYVIVINMALLTSTARERIFSIRRALHYYPKACIFFCDASRSNENPVVEEKDYYYVKGQENNETNICP